MKHVMIRWGTGGVLLLALAGCDGGSGQSASPAVTANETVAAAPTVVVNEAAPTPPVTVEIAAVPTPTPTPTPAPAISKPAPTPPPAATQAVSAAPAVIVAKPAPTPAPAVVKAPPPVVVVAATPTPPPAVMVAAAPPPPAAVTVTAAPARAAADPDAAQALFKANDCTKCHAVDKVKKGPSLKKIAADLRGSADAQDKVIKNITTGPMIKLADGTEQEHKIIDSKDQKELKNLADWILSH